MDWQYFQKNFRQAREKLAAWADRLTGRLTALPPATRVLESQAVARTAAMLALVPPRWRAGGAGGAILLALLGVFALARRDPAPAPEPAREPVRAAGGAAAVTFAQLLALAGPASSGTAAAAPARVPEPDAVRGLYLNAWAAGSSRKLAQLVALAERTEINAFVVDVKEGGRVSYRSAVPLAREIGANSSAIPDVGRVLAELGRRGIYPIARIVVFKDPVLARARPDLAIRRADGSLWHDHHGDLWVDPYNREVWDYNIALAREAVALGFAEVQWDYVRFPDVPASTQRDAVYPAARGRTRALAIREFLRYARQRLAELGVPVTADVFGLTVSAADDMGIGQKWELMVDAVDVLLPMVYPSHFARGSYGIGDPNARPYQTVQAAMAYALRRTRAVAGAARIRPWLQDFTLGPPRYGAAQVRAQIQAVYDAGIDEWVLWNPASRYSAAALAPAGGAAAPVVAQREQATPASPAAEAVAAPADAVREQGEEPAPEQGRPRERRVRLLGVPATTDSPSRR
ncbi:MAG: putative glycoside hydrolase [Gemmatimonadetes bacterium]|nr:putative glycoside hydrolase [Gemmatimonadota bacterium]